MHGFTLSRILVMAGALTIPCLGILLFGGIIAGIVLLVQKNKQEKP